MQKKVNYILVAGLIAGTLDGLSACIQFYLKTGRSPAIVFKYIASAVFGKAAYTADNMVFYGVLLHFLVAILFSAGYFVVSPYFKTKLINPYLLAIVFGGFIWATMNLIVVPLSRATAVPINTYGALTALGILTVCVAFPIVLVARKYYRTENG